MWTMKANLGSQKEEEVRNHRRDSKYIHPALCSCIPRKTSPPQGAGTTEVSFFKGKEVTQRRLVFPFYIFFQKQNRINKCALLKINWKYVSLRPLEQMVFSEVHNCLAELNRWEGEILLKFYARTNYFETFMRRQIFPNTLMLEDSLIANKF